MGEDRRPVGRADVAELAVPGGGVDAGPELRQQLLVTDLGRVEHDLYRLGMAGGLGRYLLVGRIGDAAPGVARGGRDHARDFVEVGLDAPEAAARKGCPGRRLCPCRAGSAGSEDQRSHRCGDQRADRVHAATATNFSATPLLQ